MTEFKWLTIKEAALLAHKMGLDRTNKTFRSWARRGHVAASKKDTANSEMWVLDHDELVTKIKTELEFEKQKSHDQTSSNTPEPVQTRSDGSEPVRASAPSHNQKPSENAYQQGSNQSELLSKNKKNKARIRQMENEILILKTDLKWRNKIIHDQKEESKTLLDEIKGQSQFIGHLKTKLYERGESADESFLKAPVPKSSLPGEGYNRIGVIKPEIVQDDLDQPN